jgi:hypothetical protein
MNLANDLSFATTLIFNIINNNHKGTSISSVIGGGVERLWQWFLNVYNFDNEPRELS